MLALPLLHGNPAPTPGQDPAAQANLVFVGDLMLGRYVRTSMLAHGYDAPFAEVSGLLKGADLAVGNLEGPLVPPGAFPAPAPSPDQVLLTGDSRSAPAVAASGIRLLSLANNHSYDAGTPGLKATISALRGAGIAPIGLADAPDSSQSAVIRDVRGVRIAFLAYTAIPPNQPGSGISYINPEARADRERLSLEVAQARKSADVVAVVMHWGTEYSDVPDDVQRHLARLASEAGANLVVGAHPHVAQGVELLGSPARSTLVAYSLGNALFDQQTGPTTRQALALECTVDHTGVKSARLIPLETQVGNRGFVVRVEDDARGQAVLLRAAVSTAASLRYRAVWNASQSAPGIAIAYRRADGPGDLSSVEDLGSGAFDRVQLRNGTLIVSASGGSAAAGGLVLWQSDPGWRVTGYTVGDADGDGQPELIYALWKKSLTWQRPSSGGMKVDLQGGAVLPHIYINGWRRGEMRPVWHGSPRPAPALSLSVVPVGSGGKPLLAVLEGSDPARETAPGHIRLWEWTGGFGYELAMEMPGVYSEMWGDGKVLVFR
ncbi:MAG: CapA family protein [Actinomycetota bacterium]|nr:CapA family protein [Actinomycetota bacterium]